MIIGRDEQDTEALDLDRWSALARDVLADEGYGGELGLTFVDEQAITALNAEHMGYDQPTDVLAFPLDDEPDAELLGDVVVCPAVARLNADGRDAELDDELALLVVHGVLHVVGHDHAEPEEKRVMQERERHHLGRSHLP
ncbi:MAG: rRNA maturation RNase YbeY [Actinomycetia bacterium]|nr:rRNA maturation RNase YbeY [Actinomycetes bacterium]